MVHHCWIHSVHPRPNDAALSLLLLYELKIATGPLRRHRPPTLAFGTFQLQRQVAQRTAFIVIEKGVFRRIYVR